MKPEFLEKTESICPVCLKVLSAEIWERGEAVYLERECSEHGPFSTVIWRGKPDFRSWKRPKQPLKVVPQTTKNQGCPYDCGLCPDHGQNPCTVLLEITERCDLNCPVCFANSGGHKDFTPLSDLIDHLHWIKKTQGQIVLQISGGEPTLHPQLPELVEEASKLFPAVQLNTNGLRLASQSGLAKNLAKNGLSWVFLQFDGMSDWVFQALRGQPLISRKMAAVAACEEADLSVVLVPTTAKGLNDRELGPIVNWARSKPIVRGVHIQPMTQTGRNHLIGPEYRMTIPEILKALSDQTDGLLKPEQAFPPGCEHERCSFHLRFRRLDDGQLIPQVPRADDCCCGPGGCPPKFSNEASPPEETDSNRTKAVEIIIKSWGNSGQVNPSEKIKGQESESSDPVNLSQNSNNQGAGNNGSGGGLKLPMAKKKPMSLDDFLAQARKETFSVTGMAFQDSSNMDLARLKGCCVHIFRAPDRLIPFCAMNLTSSSGRYLYRKN
ncbi:MAG: radical SAM protein [Deltaproteobacteria bacterium]|jgi:uncharacterized radical SAM superfamily Fe-S cluster-containing enzyme|nr:radical SAM protein [Deltaproteobacteria bacterium]